MNLDKSKNKNEASIRTLIMIISVVTALVLVSVLILIVLSVPKDNNPNDITNETGSEQYIDLTEKVKYTDMQFKSDGVQAGPLVLVNNFKHDYKFPASESEPIVVNEYIRSNNSTGYGTTDNNIKLRSPALENADQMLKAFSNATKKDTLLINSAFRTYDEQKGKEIPEGYSDSHTGYGFSLKFNNNNRLTDDPEAYDWLKNNCYKYGFIIRYPTGKESVTGVSDYSYYFRYVGYPHAYYMTHSQAGTIDEPMTLEEYTELLKDYTANGEHLTVSGDDGHTYEIYTVAVTSSSGNTKVKVPRNRIYEISGNNDGSFVVTVTIS